MTDVTTIRTPEEIAAIEEVCGDNDIDTLLYKRAYRASKLELERRSKLALLEAFDKFCVKHDIKYFLFAMALRGAVSYEGFVPNTSRVDVGMERAEYERFLELYASANQDRIAKKSHWRLHTHYDDRRRYRKIKRMQPLIRSTRYEMAESDGDPVFTEDSVPLASYAEFEISIFDDIPADLYAQSHLLAQMEWRNNLLFSCLASRGMTKKRGYSKRFLYRFVPLRWATWLVDHKAQTYAGQNLACVTRLAGSRLKIVMRDDLGGLTRRNFAGVEAYCPEKPDIWAPEPILETPAELKRLQEDAKAIVSEIDRVCAELDIPYFACGGTLIGHARHDGFIPWDDDIDVGMLRADYERFKQEAGALIDSEQFFLQTRETDPNIPYLFSKVRLNNSEYLTKYNKDRDFHKGICVDVFPFDYVPNDPNKLKALIDKAQATAQHHHDIARGQLPLDLENGDPEIKQTLSWRFARWRERSKAKKCWAVNLADTQKAYDKVVESYDDKSEGLDFVASFTPTFTIIRTDDLYPAQRIEFEDIEIMVPRRPDIFLRMQYGDYMLMPPMHQRCGHDLLLWSDDEGVGGGRTVDDFDF
ncbi:MAG: LicD family protein [Coriobacteriaceae bacterium]|nr:LicD family protein [Coriobacteriaceae bacterium]